MIRSPEGEGAQPENKKEGQELGVKEWLLGIKQRWEQVPEFKVDGGKLAHLVIICDGNRRAANLNGLPPVSGHVAGVEVIKGISRASRNWGIKTLTFWVWSTENWKREAEQVSFVMELATQELIDEPLIRELVENEVRFVHLGRKDRIPDALRNAIMGLERQTAGFSRFQLNLALDYGGEDELERAVRKIANEVELGRVTGKGLDPGFLSHYLDTAGQESPDLVIRTGEEGEIYHTSGFMPLQIGYAGLKFLPDLFPNLTPTRLLYSIDEFIKHERRLGR